MWDSMDVWIGRSTAARRSRNGHDYDAVGSVRFVPVVGSKMMKLVDDVLEGDICESRRGKGARREALRGIHQGE